MDIKKKCEKVAMQLLHGDEPHVVKVAGKLVPILLTGFTAKVALEIERVAREAVDEERRIIVAQATEASNINWNEGDNTASIVLDNFAEWIVERSKSDE